MKIPVQNLYYLLLYAWDHVGEAADTSVAAQDYSRLQDLFAHVLADATTRLIARGLDRGYLPQEEQVRGIRGKLQLSHTLKRNLAVHGRTHCAFDELVHDVLHNQIIKATLRSLLGVEVDIKLRERVRRLYQKLDTVSDMRISVRDFGRVQIHRNNRLYDFALRLCRIIHENLMVEPNGETQFRDFRGDERKMGAVFEDFVRNFYHREQRIFGVSSPHIPWHDAKGSDLSLRHLPIMRSDVVLESPAFSLVLDTKFYNEALTTRYGGRKVRSDHLYQILSYVQNRATAFGASPHAGMLLYPVVDHAFTFDYRLNNVPVMVRSINLDQSWPMIHHDMLKLLDFS